MAYLFRIVNDPTPASPSLFGKVVLVYDLPYCYLGSAAKSNRRKETETEHNFENNRLKADL